MNYRKKKVSFLAALLALLLLFSNVGEFTPQQVAGASSSELENQLDELENQKDEIDSQIAELQQQIDSNMDAMTKLVHEKNVIDQEISLLQQKMNLTNSELTAYGLLIADKQEELDDAQAQMEKLQEENKLRIRAMEKNSRVSFWSVLFSSNSFMEYLDRMKMIREIREEDERRLQEMKEVAQTIADTKLTLEEKREELRGVREELDQMQVALEGKRQEADAVLIELKAQGDAFSAYMEEAEEKQDQLMDEIAKKEDELEDAKYQEWLATSIPAGGGAGANTVNGITWYPPVDSHWGITSPFGYRWHPLSGIWKMHKGIDIAGPYLTPIKATRSGYVDTAAFEYGGAGNYVQINHGDGFKSIYMHMDYYIVSWGQYVSAGEVIGYMGTTGGSTGVHLHFGISYNWEYVNPLDYVII